MKWWENREPVPERRSERRGFKGERPVKDPKYFWGLGTDWLRLRLRRRPRCPQCVEDEDAATIDGDGSADLSDAMLHLLPLSTVPVAVANAIVIAIPKSYTFRFSPPPFLNPFLWTMNFDGILDKGKRKKAGLLLKAQFHCFNLGWPNEKIYLVLNYILRWRNVRWSPQCLLHQRRGGRGGDPQPQVHHSHRV